MKFLRRLFRREHKHDFVVDEYFWHEGDQPILVCLEACDCGAWRFLRVYE